MENQQFVQLTHKKLIAVTGGVMVMPDKGYGRGGYNQGDLDGGMVGEHSQFFPFLRR